MWIDVDYEAAFKLNEEDRQTLVKYITQDKRKLDEINVAVRCKDFKANKYYKIALTVTELLILYLEELFENYDVPLPEE